MKELVILLLLLFIIMWPKSGFLLQTFLYTKFLIIQNFTYNKHLVIM